MWHCWDVKRNKFWLACHTVFLWDGEFVVNGVCGDKNYIFELSSRINKITPLDFTLVISVGAKCFRYGEKPVESTTLLSAAS